MVNFYKERCSKISKCEADGVCIIVCALDAIENVDDYPLINEDACIECELCVRNCPNEALSI